MVKSYEFKNGYLYFPLNRIQDPEKTELLISSGKLEYSECD